jgi:hypothetical protein
LRRIVITVCAIVGLFGGGLLIGLHLHQHSGVNQSTHTARGFGQNSARTTSTTSATTGSASAGASGSAQVVVPSLVGDTIGQASSSLTEAGLVGRVKSELTGSGPIVVTDQLPKAGALVPMGTPIVMTLQ